MGKQINVYERPITREEYDYLKVHCQEYLISQNELVFGPLGKVEGHEWEEEELPGNEPKEVAEPTPAEEQAKVEDSWDADDVAFVDSLDYAGKQKWLKDNDLPANGSKQEVRERMLAALRDAEEVEDDGDDD